jgi:hypothetical protein
MLAAGRSLRKFYRPASLADTISNTLRNYQEMAVGWALMAGAAAFFLVERIPNFRRDLFCKLPVIGERWAEYRAHEEEQ